MKKLLIPLISVFFLLSLSLPSFAAGLSGKKVLYIDSYHEGYAWSDGITSGIKTALKDSGVELKVFRMDTKRNSDEAFKKDAALKSKAEIEAFKPDVVIASDDNAAKFLIEPFYKNASLPFVFCGVNWDEKVYGFPCKNVTGMVEVTPLPQLIEQLKPFAKGNRVGFLAPELATGRKEAQNLKTVFGMTLTEYFAKDFEDWKKGFAELQGSVDMVVLDTDGGLYKDQAADMKAFVEANSKIPSGSTYDFMAPVALITYAKVAEEQGFWSADAAMKILGGQSPADIPVDRNTEGKLIVNARIAKALGAELPFEIIQSADQVIE